MKNSSRHFLRAYIPTHLFKAAKRKALEDDKSISETIAVILSNYFIYNQKYLIPSGEAVLSQVSEDEITYEVSEEEEEQEETDYEPPRINNEGFLY